MAKLTAKKRDALRSSTFVFPKSRKFPIPDASHARNALSRAGAKGGSTEAKVRAAVHRKFPGIGKKMKHGGVMTCPSYKTGGVTHRVRGEHFQ